MKISKLAIAALAAGTLAFTGCSKKDEKKDEAQPKAAEGTPAAGAQGKTDTANKPDQPKTGDTAAAGDTGGTKITEADMEKTVTMFESLAAAAKAGGGDCDKAAAGMQKVMDGNKDFIGKMNAMKGKDPEAEKIFAAKYQERIGKVMMGMMGDLQKCQNNENIKKVFESLK